MQKKLCFQNKVNMQPVKILYNAFVFVPMNKIWFWLNNQQSVEEIQLTEQAYSVSSTSFQQSDLAWLGSPRPSYSHSFFIGLDFTNIRSIEIGFS